MKIENDVFSHTERMDRVTNDETRKISTTWPPFFPVTPFEPSKNYTLLCLSISATQKKGIPNNYSILHQIVVF